MLTPLKTPAAADLLGVSYARLVGLLRARKIRPPAKDSSGDYLWAPPDLDAARDALQIDRRRREVRQR